MNSAGSIMKAAINGLTGKMKALTSAPPSPLRPHRGSLFRAKDEERMPEDSKANTAILVSSLAHPPVEIDDRSPAVDAHVRGARLVSFKRRNF